MATQSHFSLILEKSVKPSVFLRKIFEGQPASEKHTPNPIRAPNVESPIVLNESGLLFPLLHVLNGYILNLRQLTSSRTLLDEWNTNLMLDPVQTDKTKSLVFSLGTSFI